MVGTHGGEEYDDNGDGDVDNGGPFYNIPKPLSVWYLLFWGFQNNFKGSLRTDAFIAN